MLHINDLTFQIEQRVLFEDATAAIAEGWKVGFVGRNGSGKSTLLKIIKGETYAGGEDISIRKGARLGWVDQEVPANEVSLLNTVLAHDRERANLLNEAESADDPDRIAEIQTRLADIEAHSAEARAGAILAGLGFSSAAQQRPCSAFSGGWRMRVALAGVLFSAPDLLLLDEPTNYLDLEGALWLENFLKRYPYTTLIVSHDRTLLNNCVTHIMALENGKLSVQVGDFDTYERRRAEQHAQSAAFADRQEAKRRHMQQFVDRFRAKASKAKQAQSRLKALEKIQTLPALPAASRVAPFHFPNAKEMAPPIIRLADAYLGYDDNAPVLSDVTIRLDHDDRIVILGANGEGKSTLVKTIANRLPLLKGSLLKNKKLKIAYFSQHQIDELRPRETLLDHVRTLIPEATEAQTRSAAARLGFGADKADVKVEKLSGGEKARLLLGLITFHGANLLILDEPTNHLDIESREALIHALNDFEGAVLLITHDSHLAASVAERLWLVKDGDVVAYDGDLSDYRNLVLAATRSSGKNERGQSNEKIKKIARQQSADARDAIAPLRKAVADADARIASLNAILKRLDKALADPDLYEKDVARATKLQKERGALLQAISDAEDKWLKAQAKLDDTKKA